MSEQDDASKTEDPTSRRLQQGRDKGQVAISQEVKSFAILAVTTLLLVFLSGPVSRDLAETGRFILDHADSLHLDVASAQDALMQITLDVMIALAPVLGALSAAALAAGWVQTGLLWAPEKIEPELNKISLIKGFQRLFSSRTLVEFLKGLVKITVVAALAVLLSAPLLADLERLPQMPVAAITERLELIALTLVAGSTAVMTAIAAADYAYQKWAFLKQMRMTKQEVRDEHRQQEGDPHVKARIRRLRTERAQRRMMAAVPEADGVITNPVRVAVALRYDMETMAAPTCVAKGADELARRIREVAETHKVPVLENPPLARALFAGVELDEEIPPEHYHAVAEVIGYVMRLKGTLP